MSRLFVIKFSYDYFRMKLKNHLSVIVMLAISLIFSSVTVFLYGRMKFTEGSSEMLLKNGNDGTGLIIVNDSVSGNAELECTELEKGSEWLTDSFYGDGITASTVGLDNEIIAFGTIQSTDPKFDTIANNVVFTCDGAKMSDACSRIREYYEQRGGSAYAVSFSDWFASSKAEQSLFMKYLSQLLVLVTVVTVFLMVCTQAVLTLDSRRDFGICYANGAGKKDILAVISINVIVESIIALLLAFSISWFIIAKLSEGNAAMISSIHVFWKFVAPAGILLAAAIAVLGITVSIKIINKDTPSKLIKEYTA